MNHPDSSSGPGVSPGHIVGGGHYSLHISLNDSGRLWLAQDEEKQRLAVIRFLPPELRQDVRSLETLKTRVVTAAAVPHENVCLILEWYESAGIETFIASEYVEGKPLAQVMNGGPGRPVAWDWIKPAAASVACGLEALHRDGVVHHDVQPENLLVASDKRVKLLNAVVTGLLKNPLFVPAALDHPAALRCFSPQQLAGQEPSPADDFYALGATLYELLTGAPVFNHAPTLLQDIRSTLAPPLRERLRAGAVTSPVPDEIVDFIMACLDKDAAGRPRTWACLLPRRVEAISVAAAKAEPAAEKIIPILVRDTRAEVLPAVTKRADLELIRQARDARSRRSPWALAAGLLLLAGVGGTWGYFHFQKQEQEKQRLAATAVAETQQRERAELTARQTAEKLQRETAARKKSETETRQAKEAARLSEANRAVEAQRLVEAEALLKHERELVAAATRPAPLEPKNFLLPPEPSPTTNGFGLLFNGHDLAGWAGDTNHWTVRDGFITAQARADEAKLRHLLVWQKETVGDFEMHFSYRFRFLRGNRQPNGGVNYRMSSSTNLNCYQFDLVTHAKDNGSVSDDRRRNRLGGYGDMGTSTSSNNTVFSTLGDTNKLDAVKPEDWNQCVIIARGNRLTHYLNGVLVADVTDESNSKRRLNGAIALELYTRNTNNCATFLQFSELKLKRLDGDSKTPGLARAGK